MDVFVTALVSGLLVWLGARRQRLRDRELIDGLLRRLAAQSEILSRLAEKGQTCFRSEGRMP